MREHIERPMRRAESFPIIQNPFRPSVNIVTGVAFSVIIFRSEKGEPSYVIHETGAPEWFIFNEILCMAMNVNTVGKVLSPSGDVKHGRP